MANLLESSATTQTTTPGFYTDYLSNIANQGTAAAKGAQFIGAQPLQEKAFQNVEGAAGAYKPTLDAAGNTLNQAVTAANPLASATPYLTAANSDPSQAAAGYMTPYIRSVVDALGDTGARNIRQNLSPLATAGAVGSGQFGSKRGAEVLGQTIGNANRDVLNAQSGAMNTGYQNALNAAIQQNQIENQSGATAASAASQGQQNLTQAGAQQGQLATTNQNLNLADINALSTLGAQQQTIAQNRENFPLTTLSTLSGLMAGQTIPTTQTQTASASPLSLLASGTTGIAGLVAPKYDAQGNPVANSSALANLGGLLGDVSGKVKGWYDDVAGSSAPAIDYNWLSNAGQNDRSWFDDNGQKIGTGTAVGEGE